jgi:hypothetical protein
MSSLASVLRTGAGAAEPPIEMTILSSGVRESRLDKHGPDETSLQHAATTMAALIAPWHLAIDGGSPAGHPVNKDSLEDYVRASLGMEHDETRIDPELAPHLDELSRNESTDWGSQPVTESSFTLLCVFHMADQVPGPAGYGQFSRQAFMDWLTAQLPPGTPIPYIPDSYFDGVQVGRNPETGFTDRCAVRFGPDLSQSVEVRALHSADLIGANLKAPTLKAPTCA